MTLVAYQMLIATYSPYQYQSTKVTIGLNDYEFESKTQNLIDLGYRGLEIKCQDVLNLKKKEKEEILLPPLTENQSLSVQDIKIEFKKTTPPSRYTEATLLWRNVRLKMIKN